MKNLVKFSWGTCRIIAEESGLLLSAPSRRRELRGNLIMHEWLWKLLCVARIWYVNYFTSKCSIWCCIERERGYFWEGYNPTKNILLTGEAKWTRTQYIMTIYWQLQCFLVKMITLFTIPCSVLLLFHKSVLGGQYWMKHVWAQLLFSILGKNIIIDINPLVYHHRAWRRRWFIFCDHW